MDIKSRFRNKAWIVALVSAVLLALQLILAPLNIKFDNEYVMTIINSILSILTLLGVFINPITDGIKD